MDFLRPISNNLYCNWPQKIHRSSTPSMKKSASADVASEGTAPASCWGSSSHFFFGVDMLIEEYLINIYIYIDLIIYIYIYITHMIDDHDTSTTTSQPAISCSGHIFWMLSH